MCDEVNIRDLSRCPELEEAISLLSRITSIVHELETCVSRRNGGPVRYMVEIGKREFLAWYDEVDSVVVVTPIELVDAGMWLDETEKDESIFLLSISKYVHPGGRGAGYMSLTLPMGQA